MFIWHCLPQTHYRSQTSVWYLINEKQKRLRHLDISSPLKLWSHSCSVWRLTDSRSALLVSPSSSQVLICVFCHSCTKNPARWTDSRRLLWSVASGLGFPWRPCDWCFFFSSLSFRSCVYYGMSERPAYDYYGMSVRAGGGSVSIATWLLRGQGLRKGKAVCTCWYCVWGGDDYYGL